MNTTVKGIVKILLFLTVFDDFKDVSRHTVVDRKRGINSRSMVEYCIELKLKDENSAAGFRYCLDLSARQEDYVDNIFTPEIRESMRRTLENLSSSKISDASLNRMVKVWKQDIEEGYRKTSVTLSLTSLISDQIESLEEFGNQQKPDILPPDLSSIEPRLGALPPLTFS